MATASGGPPPEPPESPGVTRASSGELRTTNSIIKRSRDDDGSTGEKKWAGWPGDNVFRLIVPVSKVGSIIGRKGEFVKKMCEETRARIKILEGVPGTPERIVMVSAREDPDAASSPAMDGLLRVHRRVIEGSDPDGDDGPFERGGGATVASRLLVAATQAGSLIGRQGATIKSIQDSSGATVRVLPPEELPLCALSDDRVVEIQGEARNVHRAVELIVSHLRKFLVDRSVLTLFEYNRAVANQPQSQSAHGSWAHSPGPGIGSGGGSGLGSSSHYGSSSLQHESFYQSADLVHESSNYHHGVTMYGRDPSIGGHLTASVAPPPPTPVITQTYKPIPEPLTIQPRDFQITQQMQIPLSFADAIIGTAGANIGYVRRTSGATITIQETRGMPGEMTVEIIGGATQVQTAQQLIQNFMAGASGPPPSSFTSVDSGFTSFTPQNSVYSTSNASGGHSGGAYGAYSNSFAY